jgi:hypothetical protein
MIAVVATATFVSSLSRLLDDPAAFGWNFDAAIVSSNGYGSLDVREADAILSVEDGVDRWSGVWFGAGRLNGETTPLLGLSVGADVRPPLVQGRHRDNDDEVVLGERTARSIGAHIGDEVELTGGAHPHRAGRRHSGPSQYRQDPRRAHLPRSGRDRRPLARAGQQPRHVRPGLP